MGCQQFAIIANCMDMLYLAKLANISPWYLCGETRQLVRDIYLPDTLYVAKVAN